MDALTVILFVVGLVLLVVGAESLVRGASRIASTLGISPLVVGLTVVAFGTSAPELAVSTSSAIAGNADVAIGNVVGSNIFNVLFILGLSALVVPLAIARQILRFDVPLMIGVSVLLFLVALDGAIGLIDGVLLTAGIVSYTAWAVVSSRRASKALVDEYAEEFGEKETTSRGLLVDIVLVVVGLALLVIGADWFVGGATEFAEALGVSDLVIGLTLVAAGTSMPELATSVIASIKGERDIAVGNVVGSNIFNILGILGLCGLVAPEGLRVAASVQAFDGPVMLAVAVATLPIFFSGYRINRGEGLIFLGYYIAYTAWLVLNATQHDALAAYGRIMLLFVLPITVLTIGVIFVRAVRTR